MIDPLFWLGLSILLVSASLTAVLVTALPALQELARAARSAEKLFDTLRRELPPTLEAIRLTGMEISDLTDDVSQGVQSAGQVVKQVDQSITSAKRQAQRVQTTTRSLVVGFRAAWRTLTRPPRTNASRRSTDRLLTPKPSPSYQRPPGVIPALENDHLLDQEDDSIEDFSGEDLPHNYLPPEVAPSTTAGSTYRGADEADDFSQDSST